MAEAADQAQHEFWRPPMTAAKAHAHTERVATCIRCGTEFIVSSLYCHACGASRPESESASVLEIPGVAELVRLSERLELKVPALIALLAGVLCVVGALSVGIFFSARTVLDWQAIQLWRIEWLVAAVAAFAAGLLLKR